MADVFTKKKRSEIMSRIRGKNTKAELLVFRYLRREKIHFQKHYEKVAGKPDIAVPSRKLAVFIDGNFWHGWKFSSWKEKVPQKYWREKIESNIRRDRKNFRKLRASGWKVLRVWEHQLVPKKREATLEKIKLHLQIRGGE